MDRTNNGRGQKGHMANNAVRFLQRILALAGMMLILSLVVFLLARACPGDPLRSWYGEVVDRMSEVQKKAMRHSLGLDQPVLTQYGIWLRNLIHGNLGISLKYKQPVTTVMGNCLGNTVVLGLISYLVTFLLAFRWGESCVLREGSRRDRWLQRLGVVTGNIPSFFLGLVLILLFAVKIPLFPTGGAYSYGMQGNFADRAWHLVLPCAVLVLGHVGYYGLMIRNLLAEEIRKDYVLLHKSQGIPPKRIVRKFCRKNIMSAMIPAMAMAVPHLLGGTYVVEMVFSYPGLGTLALESALYKDYNLLMAVTLLTAAVVILCNMLGESLSAKVDPRLSSDTGRRSIHGR